MQAYQHVTSLNTKRVCGCGNALEKYKHSCGDCRSIKLKIREAKRNEFFNKPKVFVDRFCVCGNLLKKHKQICDDCRSAQLVKENLYRKNYYHENKEKLKREITCVNCGCKTLASRKKTRMCKPCAVKHGLRAAIKAITYQRETLKATSCNYCGVEFTWLKRVERTWCGCCSREFVGPPTKDQVRVCGCGSLLAERQHKCPKCKAKSKAEQRIHQRKNASKYRRKRRLKLRAKGLDDRGKHRKRARRFGVEYVAGITVGKVAERDGHRCQVHGCGIKVRKPTKSGDKRGWTIGHIVPMSIGGGHVWQNVQCQCFDCNTRIGASITRTQFPLF